MSAGGRISSTSGLPRKAMILAAGLGTRLGQLGESAPKCMMPVAGRPLLEHTVAWLRRYGVDDLVINLHHLPGVVVSHFGDGSRWGVRITYSLEPRLLGTAGGVRRVARLFDGPFFVWYGDNLSRCRLDRLHALHQARGGQGTIALHYRENPTACGIVGLDENDRITRFVEKPRREELFSHWASAGIFILEPVVLEAIPPDGAPDFGRHLFPALLAQGAAIYGYAMSESEGLWWVDTPEDLRRTQEAMAPGSS